MLRFLLKRLGYAIISIFFISIIAFVVIQLPPGDFVTSFVADLAAQGSTFSLAQAETMRAHYGLDSPVIIQYFKWVNNLLHFDLGYSFLYRQSVSMVIADKMPLTIILATLSILFTWGIAIPVGIVSAVKQYSIVDYVFTFFGFLGLSIPSFLLALIILWFGFSVFSVNLTGLFSSEFITAPWSWARVVDLLKHIWVPVIILGVAGTAQTIRIMRANLLDELKKPYVESAIARGLSKWKIIIKYPVRLAINPVVSSIAFLFPFIISGSIIVSIVLNLPTIGPVLWNSLLTEDMHLAGAIILLIGVLTVFGTFVSDILLMLVDPRIRYEK